MAPSDGRTYLAFNLRREPFSDVRLRRAVNLALDRRAIIEDVLSGLGFPAVGFYTPAVAWAYNAAARVPNRDPAEARRIVRELKPSVIRFGFPGTPDAQPTPIGTSIAGQLEAVGFRVEAVPIPPAQYVPRLLAERDFDMVILSGVQGPDPDSMTARFGSAGSLQIMGYANPELDRVLDRGRSLIDPAARAVEYYRAQAILAADLPIAPLFESMRTAVHRDGLRGVPHEDARGLVADYTFNLIRMPNK
jgi:peptide/nickel transport system substrate-binding protein